MYAAPAPTRNGPPLDIVVVDYGMGNLASVANALGFLGYTPRISDHAGDMAAADAIVLPGVGAFGEAMSNLNAGGLSGALTKAVMEEAKPFLGICLGLQLMAQSSEELGNHAGLGWVPGRVVAIPDGDRHRVPHVGWSGVTHDDPLLFDRIETDGGFYFDHSFHLECPDDWVAARADHGRPLVAALRKDNLFATQFHPEKSQRNGLKLLRNFLNFCEGRRADAAQAG